MKICPITSKIAPIGTKFCPILNKDFKKFATFGHID